MTINTPYFIQLAKCNKEKIDTNFFFPEDPAGTNEAIRYCQDCPVKTPCGQYAIDNNILHGVWGGLSVRTRRKMRSQLRYKTA